MFDLIHLQNEVFRLLGGKGCFLRINAGDESLFISDYPRRFSFPPPEADLFEKLGIVCSTDAKRGMLLLDLSMERYQALQQEAAPLPPPPADESLFPPYALCRLLLAHPCPVSHQPMELNRRLIKAVSVSCSPHLFDETLQQCAGLLRQKNNLPYLGGVLLAQWLTEKENHYAD